MCIVCFHRRQCETDTVILIALPGKVMTNLWPIHRPLCEDTINQLFKLLFLTCSKHLEYEKILIVRGTVIKTSGNI